MNNAREALSHGVIIELGDEFIINDDNDDYNNVDDIVNVFLRGLSPQDCYGVDVAFDAPAGGYIEQYQNVVTSQDVEI